jgi:hypothetical protein
MFSSATPFMPMLCVVPLFLLAFMP